MPSIEPKSSRGHVRFADRRDAGRRLAERLFPFDFSQVSDDEVIAALGEFSDVAA